MKEIKQIDTTKILKDVQPIEKEDYVKFKSKKQIDRYKFYRRLNFTYENVNNFEDLYIAVMDAIQQMPDAVSLIIHIRTYNRIRSITIGLGYLESYETFRTAMDDIIKGNFIDGSDPIDLTEDKIIYNNFSLAGI